MGSITDLFSGGSSDSLGNGSSGSSGSSTGDITDQIAETIGEFVTTALKSVLGDMS